MGAITLSIPANHAALAGHFPGAPILPGVLLLDEMMRAVEGVGAGAGTHWRINTAKFLKPVLPGETLILEYERQPNGSIRFSVSSAGRAVAHAVLVPALADREADDGRQTR
jgi:3-hydroxymyristoyl/3-hydroxydecanoyl-(acyl carrier protein) dehydratase